jgi:exodeoxyribonuclease VII small subunit
MRRPARRPSTPRDDRAFGGHLGPGRLTTIVVFCRLNDDRSRPDPAPAVPASYEVALSELESLVASMEGGQLPLEGLLASYRRGTELLQYCRSRLEAVEQQVKVLEDGQLRPWPTP